MLKAKHFLALIIIIAIATLVAWGASQYYGERRTGQEVLLRDGAEIATLTELNWHMNAPAEVIIDPAHAANARLDGGKLRFMAVPDTYINLNLLGHRIVSDTHFIMRLVASIPKAGGQITLTLTQGRDNSIKRFVSHRIVLKGEDCAADVDLQNLLFENPEYPGGILHWGEDFNWADGFRIDFDGFGSSEITIDEIGFLPGVILELGIEDLWRDGEKENVVLIKQGRGLRLPNEVESGVFTTPPIGLGTIERLLDITLRESEGDITCEFRGGNPSGEEIEWGGWQSIGRNGVFTNPDTPARYLQLRMTLHRRAHGRSASLTGFRLRYLDPTPPGRSSPLFGTAALPTYYQGMRSDEINRSGEGGAWIRVPLSLRQFDRALDRLIAEDVNLIVAVNLEEFERDQILDAVKRYGGRVAAWEFDSKRNRGSQFYTDLFAEMRRTRPSTLIFPEKIDSSYFQDLALRGEYLFATTSGTQEEVLDRGFAWFFVMAIIGLAIVVALGPAVGYNFRLGGKELAAIGIGLLVSAIVLIPAILLTGLAGLTLPRDWAQIEIAFDRYIVSALLQEFVRALLILLPVAYLVRQGLKERTAWVWVIVVSSLLFGLGHLGYPGMTSMEVLGFVIVTTLAGAIMGGVFYATRSLTAVGILHLISNIFLSTMTDIGPRL
jgi:membrane protease YdiL (CAAX protease family)